MKEKYEPLEMEVVYFGEEDVITTSSPYFFEGAWDDAFPSADDFFEP